MKIRSVLFALALVNVLLLGPGWAASRAVGPSWLALEAVLVVGLFAVLPARRWTSVLAAFAAVATVLLSLVTLGDAATRQSLGRPLNLYLDVHLLGSVHRLLAGTLGATTAALALIGAGGALLGVTALLAVLLGRVRPQRRPHLAGLGVVGLAITGVGLVGSGEVAPLRRVSTPGFRVAMAQTRHLGRMVGERARFDAELSASRASYATVTGLLERLARRDVLLAFVESYGLSAVDDPLYAPVIRPRLDELAARVAAAGLHLATGTLVAPTQGGQSWLSHGSLLAGAWLDNQLRYDLLLASGRETLVDDFERAGYRTVAVMPAITLAWPEGERLGYDEILAHRDIEYAGPPLNWVTMPDQFTWSFVQRTLRQRDPGDRRPLFVELGLISSHAPWTPILPVLDDWDGIGDGSVFAPWEHAGDPPEVLWRDLDRIREHYALSVDYALHAMTAYAERYVDDGMLLIVLGDHQAAPLITGEDASRAVPVHVISGDLDLVQPFLDWGFAPGAYPDAMVPARRMEVFRDWFIRAFSRSGDGLAAGL